MSFFRRLMCCAIGTLAVIASSTVQAASPSFADFDSRAKAGEVLNVVFFGASLTWGANATNPQVTSYRGFMADRMQAAYPQAHFRFYDAAIGGTGSQLGVFRVDRDVLSHKPDLVFLDFSANDDIYSDNVESLASYESLVRRLVVDAKCPVVQVFFPFEWNIKPNELEKMNRRTAHLKIAKTYNCGVGDAIALISDRVEKGQADLKKIWNSDPVHPGDLGYSMFAEAAWNGLQQAIANKQVCAAPEKMLYSDTYMTNSRVRITSLGALPNGWKAGSPNLTSAYYDMLMSRWLDDEVIAEPKADRLKAQFRGAMVGLFGEGTPKSGKYRVYIDGEMIKGKGPAASGEFEPGSIAIPSHGNAHHWNIIAEGLDTNVTHTLEIEPVLSEGQELRLESICVAGGDAKVLPAETAAK